MKAGRQRASSGRWAPCRGSALDSSDYAWIQHRRRPIHGRVGRQARQQAIGRASSRQCNRSGDRAGKRREAAPRLFAVRDRSGRTPRQHARHELRRRCGPSGRARRSEPTSFFACEASSIAAIASSCSPSSRGSISPIGSRSGRGRDPPPGARVALLPRAKAICGSRGSLPPRLAAPPGRLVDRSRRGLAQGRAAREPTSGLAAPSNPE